MTDLFSDVARRRWYVLLGGLGATVLAIFLLGQTSGTHYVRGEVVFFAPGGRPGFTEDVPPGASLIPFVAAVDIRANEGVELTLPSTRAELPAAGVQSGTWARIVDTGGQWAQVHSAPTIVVEAVDPDPDRAERLFEETVSKVEIAATTLQAERDVPGERHVRTTAGEPEHRYLGPTRTETAKASVVVFGMGLLTTIVLARVFDAVMLGREQVARHTRSQQKDVTHL